MCCASSGVTKEHGANEAGVEDPAFPPDQACCSSFSLVPFGCLEMAVAQVPDPPQTEPSSDTDLIRRIQEVNWAATGALWQSNYLECLWPWVQPPAPKTTVYSSTSHTNAYMQML